MNNEALCERVACLCTWCWLIPGDIFTAASLAHWSRINQPAAPRRVACRADIDTDCSLLVPLVVCAADAAWLRWIDGNERLIRDAGTVARDRWLPRRPTSRLLSSLLRPALSFIAPLTLLRGAVLRHVRLLVGLFTGHVSPLHLIVSTRWPNASLVHIQIAVKCESNLLPSGFDAFLIVLLVSEAIYRVVWMFDSAHDWLMILFYFIVITTYSSLK